MLATSAALEALRFYRLPITLPDGRAACWAMLVGGALARLLGFNGATLLLIALFAVGSSLFFGMSWLKLMERIGAVDRGVHCAGSGAGAEERKDREIGAQAVAEREAIVQLKHEDARARAGRRRASAAPRCRSPSAP